MNAHQEPQEEEWIHDWEYKRILPETVERTETQDTMENEDDDAMDIEMEDCNPLSLSQHQEDMIFWSRVPMKDLEQCLDGMLTDDEEEFEEIEDDGFAAVPFEEISNRDYTHNDASHHRMDTASDTVMSHEEDDNTEKKKPSAAEDDIFIRQQNLLREVLQRDPIKQAPLPVPTDSQKELFQEMRTSVHKKHSSKQEDASWSAFERQQRLLNEELRKSSAAKKLKSPKANNKPKVEATPPPSPPPQPKNVISMPQRPSSPCCVSERLTRAGMDMQDYHDIIEKLTAEQLFSRQQRLLRESMQKSFETRQALSAKTEKMQGYNRAEVVSQVLKDIQSSSLRISKTYAEA